MSSAQISDAVAARTTAHKPTTGMALLSPAAYGRAGPPHELWTRLREEAPLLWCETEELEPFWAVTRHADICEISSAPDKFLNAPGITVQPKRELLNPTDALATMRVVITMDPPEHRAVRRVASPWFTPRALARMDAAVNESARALVDELAARGADAVADFATDVAVRHPLRILASALGVPREQEAKILELSNRLFAPVDPELGDGGTPESFKKLGQEFVELFLPIIEDRRAHPADDLASLLANGTAFGKPLGPMETLGYYLIVFNAGHDTTKNALAGGLRALVEHPAEFAKLQAEPARVAGAVEEILRWTSSVNYMKRTAARDCEVGGQKIRKGDALVLFYGSGNRDARVFEEPFRFDVSRKPNRHLAFGHGEHFCMGAHLARRSSQALLVELARRVRRWELAGEPQWIAASFVVGLKHLPVRYEIAEAS